MVLDHVMLKLTVLHVLHERQIELGNVVFVHVQENVADHDNALFNLLPYAIELSQELLIMGHFDVLTDRLEQLHRCVLHTFVEHLAMLVQHQAVGSAVKLLIAQTARLLVVNFVDCVLDSFPVLLCLGALHVCVAHFVPVDQEFVGWQV